MGYARTSLRTNPIQTACGEVGLVALVLELVSTNLKGNPQAGRPNLGKYVYIIRIYVWIVDGLIGYNCWRHILCTVGLIPGRGQGKTLSKAHNKPTQIILRLCWTEGSRLSHNSSVQVLKYDLLKFKCRAFWWFYKLLRSKGGSRVIEHQVLVRVFSLKSGDIDRRPARDELFVILPIRLFSSRAPFLRESLVGLVSW